jgi:hypothetical protein
VKCPGCAFYWDPAFGEEQNCPVCAGRAEIKRLKQEHFSMSADLLETIATRSRLDGLLTRSMLLLKEEVTHTLCLMAPVRGPESTKIIPKSWCVREGDPDTELCWWCRVRKYLEEAGKPIAISDFLKRRTPEELALIPPLSAEQMMTAIRRGERDYWISLHPTMPVPPELELSEPDPATNFKNALRAALDLLQEWYDHDGHGDNWDRGAKGTDASRSSKTVAFIYNTLKDVLGITPGTIPKKA